MEDYVRARTLAGAESLSVMAMEYGKMFGNIVRRATVPEAVAELLKIREQDGASTKYLGQLRTTLNRFATKFPGPILEVTGLDVDAWLRSLGRRTIGFPRVVCTGRTTRHIEGCHRPRDPIRETT